MLFSCMYGITYIRTQPVQCYNVHPELLPCLQAVKEIFSFHKAHLGHRWKVTLIQIQVPCTDSVLTDVLDMCKKGKYLSKKLSHINILDSYCELIGQFFLKLIEQLFIHVTD